MIKFIILASLCALALGQAVPPPPSGDQLPQLNRVARQLPKISDMGQTMGSGMPQLGNSGQGQVDTIDPMGLIKKGQNIAKEIMTGRKRRDVSDWLELNRDDLPQPPSVLSSP
ncbi:uncharacterized protein LOC107273216 [Cephus cinctus]|uniref:Uncharacterized protein LOC107273216 n=1 Tax=Cephus cinctus TaxID=211228 RepID=A0AAJ7FSW6_CEPCN|nr:uncharacterized protein LOC107273216 [Cephus cinctus]